MSHSRFVLFLGLAALAACQGATDLPAYRPIAAVTVELVPSSTTGGYRAVGSGYFYQDRITGIDRSATAPDACSGPFPVTVPAGGSVRWISPGSSPTLTLVGSEDPNPRTAPLDLRIDLSGRESYVNDVVLPAYPGTDTATIAIQGAAGGFPALTMRAPLPADFVAQPVADSATTAGLVVQWTPATQTGTTMQILFRYKTASTFPAPNEMIVCNLVDDGDFAIPRSILVAWEDAGLDAEPLAREVVFQRFIDRLYEEGDAVAVLYTTIKRTQTKQGA